MNVRNFESIPGGERNDKFKIKIKLNLFIPVGRLVLQ